jgi:serine/threonine-protein kinase
MADRSELALIGRLRESGAIDARTAAAAERSALRRAADGRARPAVLQAMLSQGTLAPEALCAVLVSLGVTPVCEACGGDAPAAEAAACPACGHGLSAETRLTSIDVLLARSPEELVPGRPAHGAGPGLGRYTAEKELGRGGMGIVLGARDARLDRPVAIKIIRTDRGHGGRRAQRFLREGKVLATLQHPNTVRVFEAGQHRDRLFLVMEYIRGRSLSDLGKAGDLDLQRGLDALGAICGALDAAHAAGIIHRDVKPANIVLDDQTGRARLIDFGLAQDVIRAGSITLPGLVIGTAHYLSPEQIAGRRDLDGRADVWALGVCLFELLSGERPFGGSTPVEVASSVLRKPAPSPPASGPAAALAPQVRAALYGLAGLALSKDRQDRPATAGAFAELLAAARGGHEPAQTRSADSGRQRGAPRRRRAASGSGVRPAPPSGRAGGLGLVLVGVVSVAAVGLWLAAQSGGAPPRDTLAAENGASARTSPEEAADRRALGDSVRRRPGPEMASSGRGEPNRPAVPTRSEPLLEPGASAASRPETEPIAAAGPAPASAPALAPQPEADPVAEPVAAPVAVAPPEAPTDVVDPASSSPAGPVPAPPVPPLSHEAWQVRALVAAALERSPRSEAVPALVGALADPDPVVRRLALRALGAQERAELLRLGGRPLGQALLATIDAGGATADEARALIGRLGGSEEQAWLEGLSPGGVVDVALAPLGMGALSRAVDVGERLAALARDGVEVCLVLDVTSSMVDELAAVRRILPDLQALLETLAGKARLGVVTFGVGVVDLLPLSADARAVRAMAARLVLEQNPANTTIEEAVDAGVHGALSRRVGWKKRAARAVVVFGDAPPPASNLSGLLDVVDSARRRGRVRTAALLAEPPPGYRAKADPEPAFRQIADRGGGAVLQLLPGEDPLTKLVALGLGEDAATLLPVVEAWREITQE